MPRAMYVIEEYVATVRKKDTIYMVFNRRLNDVCAFKKELPANLKSKLLDEKETDNVARNEFISYMKENFPDTALVDVGDFVPLSYIVWPYLGSIAIDADIGSAVYDALCQKYNDAYGDAVNNNAVLWAMDYDQALIIWADRKASWDNP